MHRYNALDGYMHRYNILGGFVKGLFFFAFLMTIYALISYIVTAISHQKMADKLGIDNSFLAWIPIANSYLLGKIAGDEVNVLGLSISNLSILLPTLTIISFMVYNAAYLKLIVLVVAFVINVFTFHKVASTFKPEKASFYTVLIVFLGFLTPFLYLSLSNGEPIKTSKSASIDYDNI